MTSDVAQIITALGVLVTAVFAGLAALYTAIVAGRQKKTDSKIDNAIIKVDEVHKLTNSLSDKAIADAFAKGRAEGELLGRAAETNRLGAAALARETGPPPLPLAP